MHTTLRHFWFILFIGLLFPSIVIAQGILNEGNGDFGNNCSGIATINLTCGINQITGRVGGELLAGNTDPADYLNFNLPPNGTISSMRIATFAGIPSDRSFLALWGQQGCSGGVTYKNITNPNIDIFSNLTQSSTLTIRGVVSDFNYTITFVVTCTGGPCVSLNCGPCGEWDANSCSCVEKPPIACLNPCEVYDASICGCVAKPQVSCPSPCEIYDASICGCVEKPPIACLNPCEVYDASICGCVAKPQVNCPSPCEVYDASICGCVAKPQVSCPSPCEVYDASICGCVAIAQVSCPSPCEVYDASICGCVAIAQVSCPGPCEVYDASVCGCVAKPQINCPSPCEVYDASICGCVAIAPIACLDQCEYYNSVSCACEKIVNCGIPPAEICEGIDNDGDGEIDEGFVDSDGDGKADCIDACPQNPYISSNNVCGCNNPKIQNVQITNISTCNSSTNTFIADVRISFAYPPKEASLIFTGDLNFYYDHINTTNSNVLLLRNKVFKADGAPINLKVTYKGSSACNYTLTNGGIAPVSCEPEPFNPDNVQGPITSIEYEDICNIHFIALDNIEKCSDNGTPISSDDYFLTDLTVHFVNPPTTGFLQLSGAVVDWVDVRELVNATTYTFKRIKLPANSKTISLGATFTNGNGCVYLQKMPALNIGEKNPCTNCHIMAVVLRNLVCEDERTSFDLLVTGSQTGSEYILNGASPNNIGQYNKLSSFESSQVEYSVFELSDTDNPTTCRFAFDIDDYTCFLASRRSKEVLSPLTKEALVYYPNPAQTELFVTYQLPENKTVTTAELVIYDLLGKEQIRQSLALTQEKLAINIERLDNGLYIIALKMDGHIQTGKFLKEDWK